MVLPRSRFGLVYEEKTPLRDLRAQRRPWAKPKLKSFVRLAPFLGAVAILVTNKKVPRRLTAQRRTGDSPPFDTAVIVPKCRSPNIWAAGQDSV